MLLSTSYIVLAVLGNGGGRDHLIGRSFLERASLGCFSRATAQPKVPVRASARDASTASASHGLSVHGFVRLSTQ